ncbi:Lrp/AsnC family transcriptional regulator [Streptosporangium sp. NBC_01639]|uniref:Lrp/AsnC family transcriptional regulator n=1 Tax=unclassified Streptosporangium TaxID=2632669 RepID=UPI002DDA49C1|nr:Lrp/AsnC family transcriptional regulator [Streptosporangium sp. NBC_01756]WSC84792.1 Lrp/AsnC family transcriptional regulator [Streptosporangium sp. NBC_01756]WTD56570.1 Lrp/AsnC family transcriptional regulator [Streptosporangium sp. NBC_01639]
MPESPPPRLDEIDAQLLDLLQHDAGRTLHDLGEQIGLSASAVQRRIARYRKDGLITRQVAVLDPHRFGPTVLATVLVTLEQESFEHHQAFAERMRSNPQVQQCYQVAGPWDYIVVLAARSMRDCSRLGNRLFKADDNIRRYETLLVFDTVKTGLALPLPTPQPSRSQDGRP